LARPPLAHLVDLAKVRRGLSPGDGRDHFFAATSRSMALSSIASASSFFSLLFSSSSAFSRRHPKRPSRRTWPSTCRRSRC
jgi:hypothetical protein